MGSDFDTLVATIQSTGYWRVLIRPVGYISDRIPRLPDCEKLLRDCQVSLRGWDYPDLPSGRREVTQKYVQFTTEFDRYHEICRLYLSGQYFHMFSFREDYYGEFADDVQRRRSANSPFLSPWSTLYTFTEVFFFASRLVDKGIFGHSIEISVELHGLSGRRLFEPGSLSYDSSHKCTSPIYLKSNKFPAEKLIASFDTYSREWCIEVFHLFGWTECTPERLKAEQSKFLERRI